VKCVVAFTKFEKEKRNYMNDVIIYQGWPTRPASGLGKSHVLNAKIHEIKVPLGFD
jgi:hypothetical protein